jgi:DNA repair exonuclease SbcCD ATPase subunit
MRDIENLKSQKATSKKNADDVDVKEPSQYYVEEDHDKLNKQINDLVVSNKVRVDEIGRKERLVDQLEKGEICPTCNRKLEDVDHSDEIKKIKDEIEELKRLKEETAASLVKLEEEVVIYKNLKTEYENYERNKLRKARYELEMDQKQLEIDQKEGKLANYESNKKKLDENQKIDSEVMNIRAKLDTINADIRISTTSIERHKASITTMEDKIKTSNELITKIKAEEELQAIFKVYLMTYGKNGISKTILKNMIPLINQELSRLLSESCYFNLELNINDKNELEFIMIDSETRVVKPLASGSGYERTISSLALRSVLTKVSSLPKPNIVVMDEVFGKIADENLEMVGEFFKKIKNYFEHIFVISHNPLIRNWSDNLIMVKKEENVSAIDYISTKISS